MSNSPGLFRSPSLRDTKAGKETPKDFTNPDYRSVLKPASPLPVKGNASSPSQKDAADAYARILSKSKTTALIRPGPPTDPNTPSNTGMSRAAADEFVGCGQQEGIEVWRIENLKPVPVNPITYGRFHVGDSYIILHTKEWKNKFVYNIHFWLGKESTMDETGAAAYKVVELGEKLGGSAPQHREVQDHESVAFQSYFPQLVYIPGGVDSAFSHVEKEEFQTRLLHVKGKRHVRVKQVKVSTESLNDGDVFILDNGTDIYQWNGQNSSRIERTKGVGVAQAIRDQERAGKAKIYILQQEDERPMRKQPEWEQFWTLIGGKGPIKADTEGGDDLASEKTSGEAQLFRVSDASGELVVTPIEKRPLIRRMLDTMDAFILDNITEIYVWVGRGATDNERQESLNYAKKFLVKYNRPEWIPITKIQEGNETPMFKDKFSDWIDSIDSRAAFSKLGLLSKLVALVGSSDRKKEEEVDVNALHKHAAEKEDDFLDSSMQMTAWGVKDGKLDNLIADQQGVFYEGNTYVVLAKSTQDPNKAVAYHWCGRQSIQQDRTDAERLATELCNKLQKEGVKNAKVVDVLETKESNDFLSLFKGNMILKRGDHSDRRKVTFELTYESGFGDIPVIVGEIPQLGSWKLEESQKLTPHENNTWATTIPLPSSVTKFEYKYAIKKEGKTEKEAVWEIGTANRSISVPESGKTFTESDFWNKPESSKLDSRDTEEKNLISLFHIHGTNPISTRAVQTKLDATSLNSGDAFVLSTPTAGYVWYGKGCSEVERRNADLVVDALRRGLAGQTTKVEEGSEPEEFWSAIGGKKEYASSETLQAQSFIPPPRLFRGSNATGVFKVEEIGTTFTQDDLYEDDVMMLDCWSEIYVWIGSGSNETEKKKGMEVAVKYAAAATDDRPANSPVIRVLAGSEPPTFKSHFLAWKDDVADLYTRKLRELNASEEAAQAQKEAEGKEKIAKTLEYTGEIARSDTRQEHIIEKASPRAAPAAVTGGYHTFSSESSSSSTTTTTTTTSSSGSSSTTTTTSTSSSTGNPAALAGLAKLGGLASKLLAGAKTNLAAEEKKAEETKKEEPKKEEPKKEEPKVEAKKEEPKKEEPKKEEPKVETTRDIPALQPKKEEPKKEEPKKEEPKKESFASVASHNPVHQHHEDPLSHYPEKTQGDSPAETPARGNSNPEAVFIPGRPAPPTKASYSYNELTNIPYVGKTPPPECDPTKLETYMDDAEFKRVMGYAKKDWPNVPEWKQRQIKLKLRLW